MQDLYAAHRRKAAQPIIPIGKRLLPYAPCRICPRICGVNRKPHAEGRTGFCGETEELRIASASIHRGEEPPITGAGGSGTIFITGCTLGCGFCQNWQISRGGMGRTVSFNEFTDICGALEAKGAENINIVTGSHAAPVLAEALKTARKQGLLIPVLWNSSAYEGLEALSVLEDQIDVYLPDLKTLDPAISRRFFKAPDYPDRAVEAIFRMLKYRGDLRFAPARGGGNGQVLVSGVVIRHLALPGYLEATREVIRWFADHAQGRALLSLMTQYTPAGSGAEPDNTGGSAGRAPDRYINQEEYEKVLLWLEEFGIEDGFYQELVQDNEWLPDFREKNPFSSALSVPVWHWRDGFVDQ